MKNSADNYSTQDRPEAAARVGDRTKPPPSSPLLSISQACALARIGRTRLYELLNSGELRAVKSGRRTYVDHMDVCAWVSRLPNYKSRK
jgi:excisionase family DNA binding protein